jgi:polyhydroxyalkanoate synthase subunit PhaE
MSESDKNLFDPNIFFDTWMRSMSDIWSGMGAFPFKPLETQGASENKHSQRMDKHIESGLNAWQSIASALGQPETMASAYKGAGSVPEFMLKMMQPAFKNISGMYQQWIAQIEKTGKVSGDFRFDHFDKDSLSVFNRLYDAEFRKFFNIPQLGINREYQERINKFFDQFNLFLAAMSEFLSIVFQPFEKAHSAFQEKIADLAKKNELTDDPKFYYQAWLKILEREYMILFKTPEYLSSLAKTLNAAANYKKARRDFVNDLLRQLSIPSSTDIEGVYKDMHDIKKRLRTIEKRLKQ